MLWFNALQFDLMFRYNHIKSFGDLRKKFPGAGSNGAAAAAKDDDDDVDLFGSDDEEVKENFKMLEFRIV